VATRAIVSDAKRPTQRPGNLRPKGDRFTDWLDEAAWQRRNKDFSTSFAIL